MNLEQHPALHYIAMLAVYNVGQFSGILAAAYLASKSTLNSVASIRQYFGIRWIPVGIRWLACFATFLIAWENPSVINLERFMPNIAAHMGVAWFLGFASDQIFDKILAIVLPGIQKELPAVPPVAGDK